MTDFEKWFEQHSVELFGPITQADAEKLYLAGQASAIPPVGFQRSDVIALQDCVEELTRERDSLEVDLAKYIAAYSELKAQAGEHIRRWNIEPDGDDLLICDGNHDKHEKCEYIRYTPASTVRTQVGEPCPLCHAREVLVTTEIVGRQIDDLLNPTTEPVKAQAGEPVGYHFSYTTPFGHVVWDIDYTPRPDAIECYPLVRAHPTTERPYNPLNDYAVIPMNPTEPVKAQAGEHRPVARVNRQGFIVEMDDIQMAEGTLLYMHPTTERRDRCGNCLRPETEHVGEDCPRPYTTVWHKLDEDPTTERRVIPEGWKLVPIEPTAKMKEAVRWTVGADTPVEGIWVLMLNAAPAKGEV